VSAVAIKACGVISFGMIKGFFTISAKGMRCRAFVCPRCHGTPFYMLHTGGALVGHPGITRTSANVAQFFWWSNLFRDIAHFVRSCCTCATAKSSSGLRLGVDSF
jgi:hypothetical protein